MSLDPVTPIRDDDALERVEEEVVAFLRDRAIERGRSTLILPLDGSAGSVVLALLAVEALGADRVYGLAFASREDDPTDGRLVAAGLDVEHCRLDLGTLLDRFEDAVAPRIDPRDGTRVVRRVRDRFRMACAHYAAECMDGMVLGALDRTRWLLGAATKYGETGADLLPLRDLYATDVRALATHLDVPDGVVPEGSPIEAHWPGAPDHSIELVDRILRGLVEADRSIDEVAADVDVDPGVVRQYAERHATTGHYRHPPSSPADHPDYDFFHEIELRFE